MMHLADSIAKHTQALDVNGMSGSMLYWPASKRKAVEILFVPDKETSFRDWPNLLDALHRYGTVTAMDLPGYGGMESFFTIDKPPSIDSYADYLAALIKLRFRRKHVTVVAVGFGFVVATRLLQRYPHLRERIRMVVDFHGWARYDDVTSARSYRRARRWLLRAGSSWLVSMALGALYGIVVTDRAVRRRIADNDLRTYCYVSSDLLELDNCTKHIALPLWHVVLAAETELDTVRAEQHVRVVFPDTTVVDSRATVRDLRSTRRLPSSKHIVPPALRRHLART